MQHCLIECIFNLHFTVAPTVAYIYQWQMGPLDQKGFYIIDKNGKYCK